MPRKVKELQDGFGVYQDGHCCGLGVGVGDREYGSVAVNKKGAMWRMGGWGE